MTGIAYLRQKGSCDCGIASLAMITGLPYEQVLEPFRYRIESGQGLSDYLMYDWLIREGWAWQVCYKVHHLGAINQRKDVWPPTPWAPVHLIEARVSSGNYHFAVMDADGQVFDPWEPSRTTIDHPDYQEILFVWGMWKVRSPA